MKPRTGIEPVTSSLPRTCSTPEPPGRIWDWSGKRDSNPRPLAWKANALASWATPAHQFKWWREMDSNHRRLSQRIYSPPPLATRASLLKILTINEIVGAGDGTWTRNLLITNQLLYQLSYTSSFISLIYYLFFTKFPIFPIDQGRIELSAI